MMFGCFWRQSKQNFNSTLGQHIAQSWCFKIYIWMLHYVSLLQKQGKYKAGTTFPVIWTESVKDPTKTSDGKRCEDGIPKGNPHQFARPGLIQRYVGVTVEMYPGKQNKNLQTPKIITGSQTMKTPESWRTRTGASCKIMVPWHDCPTSHTTRKTSKASKYSSACTQAVASKAVLEPCT